LSDRPVRRSSCGFDDAKLGRERSIWDIGATRICFAMRSYAGTLDSQAFSTIAFAIPRAHGGQTIIMSRPQIHGIAKPTAIRISSQLDFVGCIATGLTNGLPALDSG